MAKRLFLLLIASLIGVISSPTTLIAAEDFTPNQPDFEAVETILPPKPKPEPVKVATPVYREPANNIKIAGRTLEVIDVNSTTLDAGGHVDRYGGKYFYGHNSGAVFGGLVNMGVGSTFSVTLGGTTTNYRVENVVVFEKNPENGKLQINGVGSYMQAVTEAIHMGVHYSVSLMTCYGTSYGNGDASHRLVLFANAI